MNQQHNIQIAIDGPASSGKSTVAKRIASDLKLVYIDTGAMYRALTDQALKCGISPADEDGLLSILDRIKMEFKVNDEEQYIFVNQEDVTESIRTQAVTEAVSEVSAHPRVREELVHLQQRLAGEQSVVMDGRDIGTVVLPQAEVKIFLVASPEERAYRRHQENQLNGRPSNYEQVLEGIIRRDAYDSNRQHSPLKKADEAILIDTTHLSIDQVVQEIKGIIDGNM